jgi:hypothetical protein
VDDTAHALLRRDEERLDIATYRIEKLALVYPVAVRASEHFFDTLLTPCENELFELAMRIEEHLGSGRLEGDAPFCADDGVAKVDAATNAERPREGLERFDDVHG